MNRFKSKIPNMSPEVSDSKVTEYLEKMAYKCYGFCI